MWILECYRVDCHCHFLSLSSTRTSYFFLNRKLERKLSVKVGQGSRVFKWRLMNIKVTIATFSCPKCFLIFPNLSTIRYYYLFWPIGPEMILIICIWNYNLKCSDLLVLFLIASCRVLLFAYVLHIQQCAMGIII